ncbi:Os08g0359050 [Oryza sativa Japonica Group]|uniref:Os08g0359050 protein n=1 Tax=Oryza sativa subsp. japonica TaxID=39947 RepID=A0A0P0XEZ9_ORYSJ|nr:hypothetical protein EE612_043736 [Oryza sativa]BAT05091.1 Os08g0359050 [Oryza sativa Japonica Group]
MRSSTTFAKPAVAILSALLLLFFLLCNSSTSSPHEQPSVLRSRRLLSQCDGTGSCSTRVDGLGRFEKTPKAVFESLKRVPSSKSNPSHN